MGKALALDGNDLLVAGDIAGLDRNLEEAYTIEMWLRIDEIPPGRQEWTILAKPGSYELFLAGPGHQYAFGGDWLLALDIQGDGPRSNMHLTRPTPGADMLNGWHHFVFQGEPAGYQGAIDGRMDGGGIFLVIVDTNTSFYVGGHPARNDSFFRGAIDELRISATRRYGRPGFAVPVDPLPKDPETGALWHFDEFPSGTYSDSMGGHRLVRALTVTRRDKLTTTWGQLRRQSPGPP